ncbi:MAG: metal ABC transporter substrate-binding protein [Acidimicrobiia bacterium]
MKPRRPASGVLSLAAALPLLLTACTSSGQASTTPQAESGRLTVVATTSVLGDVVANVVGDAATVEVVLPIGADPHDYQPSARQLGVVNEADLVVANGLRLEEGLVDAVESAEADGANVLEVAPLVDPIPLDAAGPAGDGCDPTEERGGTRRCDPHVSADPVRMAAAARIIAAELAALDDSVDWEGNAERYAQELLAADEEIAATLEAVSDDRRLLVTNHDSLGYFADRYGFEVVATVIPGGTTLGVPSSAELADLVAVIGATGVPAIFAENIEPSTLAEAVAAEVGEGVAVVELYTDSLGEPGSGADTLIGMLLTNATRIAGALA